MERYFTAAVRLLFRADAAFAKPEIYEYLETRQIDYAIRLPANEVLQRKIAHLLTWIERSIGAPAAISPCRKPGASKRGHLPRCKERVKWPPTRISRRLISTSSSASSSPYVLRLALGDDLGPDLRVEGLVEPSVVHGVPGRLRAMTTTETLVSTLWGWTHDVVELAEGVWRV